MGSEPHPDTTTLSTCVLMGGAALMVQQWCANGNWKTLSVAERLQT
jgi:hypothetical protein